MKKLILCFVILFGLTGCWNYRELTQLAITTGIAIDKDDNGYKMTIMIANSQKTGSDAGGQAKASTAVYDGTGKTMYEAIKNASLAISKQIYLGHIDLLVVSEEIAKNDMDNVIDFLFRYPQTRNDFLLVISQDNKAGDILQITIPLESFPSQNVAKNLQITDRLQGFNYTVNFNDFVEKLIEPGVNPLLPSVHIVGDPEEGNKEDNIKQNKPETYLKLGMMGLFKDSKFLAWADPEESKGINIINDKIKIMGVIADWNDGNVVTEIIQSKTKTEVTMDDQLKIKISVSSTGGIQEINTAIDLSKEETIEQVKQKDIEVMKRYIEKAIALAQKNKTDIFGFGQSLYRHNPKKWDEVKDKWDEEIFQTAEIEITIDLELEFKGSVNSDIEVKK